MAIDRWNGSGNWTGNPGDWSTASPPASTDIAEIQTGTDTLTSAASVKSIVIDSGALLTADTGASLTTTRGINNASVFATAANSTVTIGGTLTNSGITIIGNTTVLSASTTVTAAGLHNTGLLILQGNATSGTTNQATLDITAAAPATATGNTRVSGDAMLEFASGGITAIGTGAVFELDGAQARVSIGSGTTSTALSGLASSAGTFLLSGDTGRGAGGASVTTTTGFSNAGNLEVDSLSFGDGGSTLTFGGTLTNSSAAFIGNIGLSAATTVTASGLDNSGTLVLQGNAASGATNLATLDITAAAPTTATGIIRVIGDALIEFKSGGITAIGSNATLELDGAEARVSIGPGTTSSALSGLASNAGTLMLRGNTSFGDGGSVVTTTTSVTNTGTLSVDALGFGDGGSTLTLGGTLTNSATANIGNIGLSTATTVTAKGLNNTGSLVLQGNDASGATQLATLDITAAATKTATGFTRVSGDAMLEFASGGIAAIGYGSWLELDGAEARASILSGTTSTALTKLASNAGTFMLRGDTNLGAGGSVVTTTVSFTNTGTLSVDALGFGDGGSSLTLGGTLTSSATANIGNTGLSAATTVTAKGLINNGAIVVQGNNASGATNLATLNITAAAPTTATGTRGSAVTRSLSTRAAESPRSATARGWNWMARRRGFR
jgi:fibronectin-binding autotransporter adhesin